MKSFYVLSFLLALAAVSAEKYDSNNDDFDIHAAVADPDTLKALVGCFLDTAVCDEVSADFKKDLPDATQTACTKCTDAQKVIYRVFLDALKNKLPKEYEAFKTKYDPEGKHFTALEAAVAHA